MIMKQNLLSLLLLALITFTGCAEKIDLEKEKQAIKDVILKEEVTFLAREMDQQFDCFVQDESTTVARWDGIAEGWDFISNKGYKEIYKNYPEPSSLKAENKNFTMKVYENTAWAVYDLDYINENDSLITGQRQIRFLEKKEGEWKIVLLAHFEREKMDVFEETMKSE
jgi:hypothetical protein